ncbi:tRNA-dihydrouridine(20a/20b) synthase [NAD(P)+]-like [Nasonia vitripennis]|uniref:tRNA-dihydrouridine(20a/20b) synthase [NAD(P)+] n=1 Tax=Nasonia vitripennis TaxID=7425 RepID=A0A7M7G9N0_NASVI|nr:tRNA-dihydrouridine(20a/20b) synthase [NAD(P)+]-like [Nasonia vitripennis]
MSQDILNILTGPQMTKVCAPMVRYSKLPFRTLVRKYDCDICFTPMILADSFVQSSKARDSEFSTNEGDSPLIVQFAAKEVDDFVEATEMVAPYSNGVDLNCGCPQRWALKDGYGADLLTKPQLVKELVSNVRNRIPKPFTVSVKIRILKDIKKTIEFSRAIEHAGVSFLTVHARTPDMRNEPIDLDSLKLVRSCVHLPMIANGNVRSFEDAKTLYEESKCNGVMVAGGILTNPAIFSGYKNTPVECIQDWLDITSTMSTQFMCMHHHLVFMLEKVLTKKEKLVFNVLNNKSDVYDFLKERFDIQPRTFEKEYSVTKCEFNAVPRKNVQKSNFEDECSINLENLFIQ